MLFAAGHKVNIEFFWVFTDAAENEINSSAGTEPGCQAAGHQIKTRSAALNSSGAPTLTDTHIQLYDFFFVFILNANCSLHRISSEKYVGYRGLVPSNRAFESSHVQMWVLERSALSLSAETEPCKPQTLEPQEHLEMQSRVDQVIQPFPTFRDIPLPGLLQSASIEVLLRHKRIALRGERENRGVWSFPQDQTRVVNGRSISREQHPSVISSRFDLWTVERDWKSGAVHCVEKRGCGH